MGGEPFYFDASTKILDARQPNALSLKNFEVVEITRAHFSCVMHIETIRMDSVAKIVNDYLKRFGLPTKKNFYGEDWYGVYGPGRKLLSTVGFEQVTDDTVYIPFISHLCCEDSVGGRRALALLTQFIEAIPLPMRGLILANNKRMRTMVTNRKKHGAKREWAELALLVESRFL